MNWKNFGKLIWDSERKALFGRTKRAWGEIGGFFLVFYAILLSYFCGMLSFFFQTVNDKQPSLTGDASFLQMPGIGIRPLLMTDSENAYTSMIFFTPDPSGRRTKACVGSIKEALKPYEAAHKENYARFWKQCGENSKPDDLQSCIVQYNHLMNPQCEDANHFGYPDGKPCVLLRLNKIYGWKPNPYTKEHNNMPGDLKKVVKQYYAQYSVGKPQHLIWVDCVGEDNFDKGNLGNQTGYYPSRGFPVSHFPFLNQYRHLQTAIMVKFNSLRPNIVVKVHCKAYAHNIHFEMATWSGGFHFELFFHKKA